MSSSADDLLSVTNSQNIRAIRPFRRADRNGFYLRRMCRAAFRPHPAHVAPRPPKWGGCGMLARMELLNMLAELREERARIEEAIVVLERLARGQGKRRGRPPAWMTTASEPKRRGRPPGSKNKPKV